MQLFTIGVNHTTAPISIRENVAFTDANLHHALSDLTAQHAAEAAILSMCNQIPLNSSLIGWPITTS
jgi:glutamyl-tRNA reductase